MNGKRSFLEVLKGMFVGIVHPAEYIENGKKGSWGSALLLAIIFSILTPLLTFFLPVNTVVGNGKLENIVEDEMPYFSLDENGLYCEGRNVWTDHHTVYIEIDTNKTTVDNDVLEDLLQSADYQSIMIIYSKEMMIYSEGQTQTLAWSELYESAGAFDKQDVIKLIKTSLGPGVRMVYFVLVVAAFIGFLLCGLLWALVGMIAASSSGAKISFGDLVKASIYIRVIWSTIRKLLKVYVFGGTSMLMWTFGFIIILVYMLLAVNKYAKRQANNTYGVAQAGVSSNMYYGGQSMGNMAGQYNPMGMNMNQGMDPGANPNMYQNNQNVNPNMYQNNQNMNPNMYQNNQNMNPNMYQNDPNMNQNSNPYSYENNSEQQNNDQ